MISQQKVKDVIESKQLNPKIEAARIMNEKLLLHVEGIETDAFLARINEYENEEQHKARTKHAVTNEFVTEELLRPTDNIWSAKGGSRDYKFKGGNQDDSKKEFISKISNVKNQLSISQYIEQIWFQKYITDPNGLIFIETNPDEQRIYPTYKSIQSIRDYDQSGIFVEWVIFEPHDIEYEGKEVIRTDFWVVDESNYYLYRKDKKGLRRIKTIPHIFEKVPAVLCSNIVDNKTGWKKSPIDKQIGLLNKYLVSNSVLSISEFQNVYYRTWEYFDDCPVCQGSKLVSVKGRDGSIIEEDCGACGGTGRYIKKDVTDTTLLRRPQGDETSIAPPFGIEAPPTEGWQLMVDSVDRYFDLIFRSHWNATVEKKNNETATGRFIDVQPVNNRLNSYSYSAELIHSSLVNLFGKYYYPETFEIAIIQYGRRYLIETPDQIWEKYIKAVNDNANPVDLDLLSNQYYESEFRDNKNMYVYYTKLKMLDPFPHWDIEKVLKLGVTRLDYNRKLYINEFKESINFQDVINTDIDKLKIKYEEFINNKLEKEIQVLNSNNNE